jgi:very-short-patch-repair endonuclease
MSRASQKLHTLLRQLFPTHKIVEEYTFTNGLRLDFYIPDLNVAFEMDGEQHFEYIDHFHKTKSEYYISQNRDEQKDYICEQLGINLIRFRYDDELTIEAIQKVYFPGSGIVTENGARYKKVPAKQLQKEAAKNAREQYKQSEAYEERKEKARQYRKKRYRQFKKSKLS